MLSIIILLILAWSFYIGYSRGIVLQGYYAAATMVSMLVAGAFIRVWLSLSAFGCLMPVRLRALRPIFSLAPSSFSWIRFFMLVWPISLFLRLSTSLGAFWGFLRI